MSKERFISFLKKNEVYEEYLKELKKQGRNFDILIDKYEKRLGPIISGSFPWSSTDKGYEFWVDLSHKWEEECKKPQDLMEWLKDLE